MGRPATPPGIERYAQTVVEALDGLGIGRLRLLGQHTGASIAVEAAATRPDRITTTTSSCSAARITTRTFAPKASSPARKAPRSSWTPTARTCASCGTSPSRDRSGPAGRRIEPIAQLSSFNRLNAGPSAYFATLAVFQQDARDRIPHIEGPPSSSTATPTLSPPANRRSCPSSSTPGTSKCPTPSGVPMQQRPGGVRPAPGEFLLG